MAFVGKIALIGSIGFLSETQGIDIIKSQIIKLKQINTNSLAQVSSASEFQQDGWPNILHKDVMRSAVSLAQQRKIPVNEFASSENERDTLNGEKVSEKKLVEHVLERREVKPVKFEIQDSGLTEQEQIKLGIIEPPTLKPNKVESQKIMAQASSPEEQKVEEKKINNSFVQSYEVAVSQPIKLTQTDAQKEQQASINTDDLVNGAIAAPFKSDMFLQSKVKETPIIDDTPGKSMSIMDIVNVGQKDLKIEEAPAIAKTDIKLSAADLQEALDNVDTSTGSMSRVLPVSAELSDAGFKVPLKNEDGSGYVGTIYVGSEEKPINVLFDTGSDYLAITSDLCDDKKLGKTEEDVPVFNTTSLTYVHSGKDHRKCKSTAYESKKSTTAKEVKGADDEKLDYGSAKLAGKLYQDQTCIDGNKTSCTNFDFLALYQAEGLDDVDGILGLAVHPDKKKRNLNYVWQLKNQGIIDKALVSFSVSGPGGDEESYAQFGGINPDQIVGGVSGLQKMKTMAYRPDWTESVKQWALEGQSLAYAGEECQQVGQEKKFPAIIDTGSSAIGVPEKIFGFLKEKWHNTVPKLNCIDDDNFCQVMTPCDKVEKSLKPIQLQISGQTFEIPPKEYLHQAEGDKCQFAIHENQMKGSSGNLFVIGDTLLQHLYQVYDFENETISLGVNSHSNGKVQMYPAGQRPEGLTRLEVGEDMSPLDVKAMNAAM